MTLPEAMILLHRSLIDITQLQSLVSQPTAIITGNTQVAPTALLAVPFLE